MSRSYKKSPVYTDRSNRSKSAKSWKKIANRQLRRIPIREGEYFSSRKAYRKKFESWTIRDYKFYIPLQEEREWYEKTFPEEEFDEYLHWAKLYKRK